MSEHRTGIGILASGSGTTAEEFIVATQDGRVDGDVRVVICNNPPEKAGIYDRVDNLNRRYGLSIRTEHISGRTHPGGNIGRGQTLEESEAITNVFRGLEVGHVCCMGYMKQINDPLLREYGWLPHYTSIYQARMSNTHPAPLPETTNTYGIFASELVLELGLAASKHTVHLVGADIDGGPKLSEYPVLVRPDDTAETLFARVQKVEKRELPRVINLFLLEQQAYYDNTLGQGFHT